ncbi:MAG: PAS domain S-box protein [Synechococcaceae cyanobacterium RL_1_2]|nr:PAS domain S-box protein [Synechococcaceae cyanobacterium RL_1_2]
MVLTFTSMTAIVGVLLGSIHKITRPIAQLVATSQSMAEGNLEKSVISPSRIKEIGIFVDGFETMRGKLHHSFEQIEQALKESEEKYTTLFQFSPIGILITDPQGKFLEANNTLKQLFGNFLADYQRHLHLGDEGWLLRGDGSPLPKAEWVIARAIKENCFIQGVEEGFVADDGSIRWLRVSAAPIPLPNYGVAIAYVDVTDKKNQEWVNQQHLATLAQSEKRYRQVVEQQTDFILRSEPDTTITFANESLCHALGCPLEQVVGQKWINFAHPDDLKPTLEHIGALTPADCTFRTDNRDRRKDGVMGWTEWINQGIFNDRGELIEIQSVGRDITALKTVELALRKAEERFQQIALSSPAGIYIIVLEPQGDKIHFEYVSSAFEHITGLTIAELLADFNCWRTIIHPDDRDRYYQSFEQSYQNLSQFICEWRIITPKGEHRWIQVCSSPELGHRGEITWYGVMLDVTAQKTFQIEKHRLEQRLEFVIGASPNVIYNITPLKYDPTLPGIQAFDYDVNLVTKPFMGFTPEEFYANQKLWMTRIHPEELTQVLGIVGTIFEKQSIVMEYRFQDKQGEYHWLRDEQRLVRGKDEQTYEIVGSAVDITDLKETEKFFPKPKKKQNQRSELKVNF